MLFPSINQMINECYGQISQLFNPIDFQHGSTIIAIKAVFVRISKTRTLGYNYHLPRSADIHRKYLNNIVVDLFQVLANALKSNAAEGG